MRNMLEQFSLEGKVAIVTGASRGLGAASAEALAGAGADVVLVARSDLGATERLVTATGRRCLALPLDVTAADAPERILHETMREFGRADILVNNAGIIRREPFLEFSAQNWRDVLDLNLDSVFHLSQVFANDLVRRSRPGKIIQLASMLSFQGGQRVASYCASKSAIHGLTKAMANELAASGINVNAIAPGYMATDNTAALRADAARSQAILGRIPARRWGTPEDLQGAIVFLASRASDYMHGFTLAVDGGWLAS